MPVGDHHDVERGILELLDHLPGGDYACRPAFFGGMVYLVEQAAAFSIVYLPSLLHLLIGQMR